MWVKSTYGGEPIDSYLTDMLYFTNIGYVLVN